MPFDETKHGRLAHRENAGLFLQADELEDVRQPKSLNVP
jgi:hypothetical protein